VRREEKGVGGEAWEWRIVKREEVKKGLRGELRTSME